MYLPEQGRNSPFTDLLFNLLMGVFLVLILAILLINPVAKQSDINTNADFLITVDWQEDINCDVDLHIKDPADNHVWFQSKTTETMHLDRDDLGKMGDEITVDGKKYFVKENREIITIRKVIPGKYILNAHLYRCRDEKDQDLKFETPVDVILKTEIVRINPEYKVVHKSEKHMTKIWKEVSIANFEIDAKNNYTYIDDVLIPLVRSK